MKLTNRTPLTERLQVRIEAELAHAIHRASAKAKVEPIDWVRAALKEATRRELGEAA